MASRRTPTTRGKAAPPPIHKPGLPATKAAPAATDLDDLPGKTKEWLLERARSAGLTGVSKLTKAELADKLRKVLAGGKAGPPARPAPAPVAAKPARAAPAAKAAAAKPAEAKPAAAKPATAKAKARSAPEGSPVPESAAASHDEQDPAGLAKLAVSKEAAAAEPKPATIPWSYGLDRVTAAAIDPEKLYAYWEVTDQAIDRARAQLGQGGPGAWLDVRVYDTTGVIFDGTNAHSYFDHGVDRGTRQWFFHVGKPSSSAFVEIGLRSAEGYFVSIARSGRVDFPRREPAPWRDPEWMTVQPWSGEVADVHRGAPGRGAHHAPPPGGGAPPARFEQIPLWVMREPGESYEVLLRQALEHGWERIEWQEGSGEGWFALEGRVEWESPHVVSSWEAGPFTYPVEIEAPSREEWSGRAFAYRVGDVTHVVYGPWRVVMRNLGARAEHAVIGSWVIYRSWAVTSGHELRAGLNTLVQMPGASEQLALGASERRWVGASELLYRGASEVWRAGASEIAYRGASERIFLGASQWMARGASERQYQGGSESRLGGASERQHQGGSESRLGGSEQRLAPDAGDAIPYPAVPPASTKTEE